MDKGAQLLSCIRAMRRMNPPCDLQVRFFQPPPELEGCFSVVYRADLVVEGNGTVEDVLLPEWSNIRVFRGEYPVASLPDCAVNGDARMVATGPTTQATRFRLGSTRMWGVGLFPEGIARLSNLNAGDVANHIMNGEEHPDYAALSGLAGKVLACEADDEVESTAIFEFFAGQLREAHHADDIRSIHNALLKPEINSAGAFAEECGLNKRKLERLAKRYFGFTPKALLRRQRFVRTLSNFVLKQPIHWTAAMDSEYYDQAQFVREFKQFMDMTPQAFAAVPHPIQDVFMIERAKVWGAAAQALDKPKSSESAALSQNKGDGAIHKAGDGPDSSCRNAPISS